MSVNLVKSPVAVARKGKKYGHVSLAYALNHVNGSSLTGKEIAAIEIEGDPKAQAALVKAIDALPTKPGNFWAILEGRTEGVAPEGATVFLPKAAPKARKATPKAPKPVAAPSDLA